MSGGEIAGLLAASALALFVLFLGYPLIKLGRLIGESKVTVKEINATLPSLLSGINETVELTNKQLNKLDEITDRVTNMSESLQGLVSTFTASVGSPLMKLAGYIKGISSFIGKKK
jgi:methyl-accepting chemotaxis protein